MHGANFPLAPGGRRSMCVISLRATLSPISVTRNSWRRPRARPRRCGPSCSHTSRMSERKAFLRSTRKTPSTLLAHKAGYIDRDNEIIVGLQTDQPFKRAIFPYGGLRMVEAGLKAANIEADPQVHEAFTSIESRIMTACSTPTHRRSCSCRKSGIITGLPDAYGRGRIIGDYRRVALYGVDRLLEAKQAEREQIDDMWPTDEVIRSARSWPNRSVRSRTSRRWRSFTGMTSRARDKRPGGGAVDLFRLPWRHQRGEWSGDVDRPHLDLPRHLHRARFARRHAEMNPAPRSFGTSLSRSFGSSASCGRRTTTRCSAATPIGPLNASVASI